MQRPCQDIMPRTLTRQTKTNDVKLKQMTSLIGLARDVKLTAAASGFLKSPILFYSFFKMIFKPFSRCKHAGIKEMDEKWLGRSYTEAVCFPLLP